MFRLIALSALLATALGASIPRDERISGGTNVTDIRDAHFVVSIRFKGTHICGGAIINVQHVITAAECVKGLYVHDITVHADSTTLWDQTTFEAYLLYVNSHYNTVTRDYNVAILKVKTKFSSFDPVLIESDDPGAGWPVWSYGWGATSDGSSALSVTLNQVEMEIIERDACSATNFKIADTMSCTASKDKKGICKGDFGGPLVDTALGHPRLIGVSIQSSLYCGVENHPNVFFRIDSVRPWIKTVAGV